MAGSVSRLETGCDLISGFDNPVSQIFDDAAYDRGELVVANAVPYSEVDSLSAAEAAKQKKDGNPLEFGHTLDDQIGGQIESGFVLTGFYEDRYSEVEGDLLGQYISTCMATKAYKGRADE